MSTLTFGLSVAAIGMLVVFSGLVILIGCIKVISLASASRKAKKAIEKVEELAPVAEPAAVAPVADEGVTPEIIAAITAAIAAVWQGETGFCVRRVKRVSNASAWNRAGREDQVYSRM